LGRCSVRIGYYVSRVNVVMECSTGIVRVCGGVNEDVSDRIGFVVSFLQNRMASSPLLQNRMVNHII